MLLNARVTAFTNFVILRENHQGRKLPSPPIAHTHTHTHTHTHNQITVNIFFKKLMVTLGNALKNSQLSDIQ